MRIAKMPILLVLSLLTVTSLFAAPVNCQVQTVTLTFRGRVSGDCLLIHGTPAWGPLPSPVEWLGLAGGTAGISGLAEATLFQIGTPYGDTYDSEDLEARGSVSLSWIEDGRMHMLTLQLRSSEYTRGVFAPVADFFTLPVGGDPSSKVLTFKGIYASDQGPGKVEGFSLFGFAPNIVPLPGNIPCALMILIDAIGEEMFTILWLPQDTQIPMGPGGPTISVPAARTWQATVDIISRP